MEEARRAAARQFGRRHYRLFAVAHFGRRAVTPLLAVALAALVGYAVWRWHVPVLAWTATRFVPAVLTVVLVLAAAAAGVLAWRRWGWLVQVRAVQLSRPQVAAYLIVPLLVLAGGFAVWQLAS